jgi:hypothetical protein
VRLAHEQLVVASLDLLDRPGIVVSGNHELPSFQIQSSRPNIRGDGDISAV